MSPQAALFSSPDAARQVPDWPQEVEVRLIFIDGLVADLHGVQHRIRELDPAEGSTDEGQDHAPSVVELIQTPYRELHKLRSRQRQLRQSLRFTLSGSTD
jgi:hypothetical protein